MSGCGAGSSGNGGLVAGLATAACTALCRCSPGAAMVSLKRCCAGVGVMRGCAPVAITRGAGGIGDPGTRGCVVLGAFGGAEFGFWESSFATYPQPRASAPIGRQRL